MIKKVYPLSKVYRLIEPGPVVLVTTAGAKRPNIMTMSWHTMMEFEPPRIGCVLSNRNYSFDLLKASKECVINIPSMRLIDKTVKCGNVSGKKTDKFSSLCLTPEPASRVKALMIKECFSNLECRIADQQLVEKYNFFILEVLRAWIDPLRKNSRTIHHHGRGVFSCSGRKIKILSKAK